MGLVIYIAVYDLLALRNGNRTMSEAFYALSRHRVGGVPLMVFWLYLTLHLLRLLPRRFDVFYAFGEKHA